MIIIIIIIVNVSLSLSNLSAADPSEDTVLLSEDRAVFHCQTKTSEGTADCDTCEDTESSEKEKLLEKENGNKDSASD